MGTWGHHNAEMGTCGRGDMLVRLGPGYRVTAGHQPFFHVLHQIAFSYDKPDHDAFCHSASPTGPAETHLF